MKGLLIFVLPALLWSIQAHEGEHRPAGDQSISVIPLGITIGTTPLIAARNGHLYLLDDHTNRLFICDELGKVIRIVGEIGAGPGQFYKPSSLAVTSRSIIVYDKGNRRIEVLSLEGSFKRAFEVSDQIFSMAVGEDELIYINDLSFGKLITVLDSKGKIVRSFGALTQVSALYHTSDQSRDHQLDKQSNRVRLAVDKLGHICTAFVIAPVVREYSATGDLVREVTLAGDIAARLRGVFWHGVPPETRITSGVLDDRQVPFLIKDIVVDPVTNHVIVVTAFATLFIFDSECRQLKTIEVRGILDWQLWKMAVEGRSIWFVRVFLPGSFHGVLPAS